MDYYWGVDDADPDELDPAAVASLYQHTPDEQPTQQCQRVSVVGPQYCYPERMVLVLHEQPERELKRHRTITDAAGTPLYKLEPHASSRREALHSQRQLVDVNTGKACAVLDQRLMSVRGTWRISSPEGARLADAKPGTAALAGLKASIKIYLNDGDKQEDFVIKGNMRSKSFTVFQIAPGSDNIAIANITAETCECGAGSSHRTFVHKYYMTIEPGVDTAFITALACICDFTYKDMLRERSD